MVDGVVLQKMYARLSVAGNRSSGILCGNNYVRQFSTCNGHMSTGQYVSFDTISFIILN